MRPLGSKQLALLRSLTCGFTVVVADDLTRSLCNRGLMKEATPGAFVSVTAEGFRAIADAIDRGLIPIPATPGADND
jgi:hypothetical protein